MPQTLLRRRQEAQFAHALAGLAAELRLIDPVVLATYIRDGSHANLRDVVASSCELLFEDGAWRYGGRADASLSWTGTPEIAIDLEFSRLGVRAFMALHLHAYRAFVHLHHIAVPGEDCEGERVLVQALADARRPGRAA